MIRFHRLLCFSYKKGETFGMYAVTFIIYSIWLCRNPELTYIGPHEQMPVGLGMATAVLYKYPQFLETRSSTIMMHV